MDQSPPPPLDAPLERLMHVIDEYSAGHCFAVVVAGGAAA
jgi:hypothetical protein